VVSERNGSSGSDRNNIYLNDNTQPGYGRVYPAQYLGISEEERAVEDYLIAARETAKSVGQTGVSVNIAPSEALAKLVRNKQEMLWWIGFEKHIEDEYIRGGDLSKREWVRKVMPRYFQMREKGIDDQIDLDRRLAKLKLNGPQTIEDAQLEYLLSTGQLTPPMTPAWAQAYSQDNQSRAYERGLINLKRFPKLDIEKKNWNAGDGPWGTPTPFTNKNTNMTTPYRDWAQRMTLGYNPDKTDLKGTPEALGRQSQGT